MISPLYLWYLFTLVLLRKMSPLASRDDIPSIPIKYPFTHVLLREICPLYLSLTCSSWERYPLFYRCPFPNLQICWYWQLHLILRTTFAWFLQLHLIFPFKSFDKGFIPPSGVTMAIIITIPIILSSSSVNAEHATWSHGWRPGNLTLPYHQRCFHHHRRCCTCHYYNWHLTSYNHHFATKWTHKA